MRSASIGLLLWLLAWSAPAEAAYSHEMSVVVAHHKRVTFQRDVSRIAVGDGGLLEVQLLDSRQILALGKAPGATSLILWFTDGTHRTYRVIVERDLALLRATLTDIHPSLSVTAAPDRDAVVLRGLVPDASFSFAAESAAHAYLAAGGRGRNRTAVPVLRGEDGRRIPSGSSSDAAAEAPVEPIDTAGAESFRADAEASSTGQVINLVRVENLPALTEERIKAAIDPIGGEQVTVRRYLKGDVPDDGRDVLVLEGRVPDQTALVRVLSLAARLFLGEAVDDDDIRVIANEAGGLQQAADDSQAGGFGQGGGGAGALGGLFGGGGQRLNNRIESNVARAKVLDVADGRILSFIEVQDLPQVRVNVKFYEVNRDRTLSFLPSLAVAFDDSGAASLPGGNPPGAAGGDDASAALLTSVLGGLTTGAQFVRGDFAVGAAFSLLESNNLARVLSAPSLKVLSGERARFLVGGEIPVRNSFSPAFGSPATGVFESVQFVPFGVQLDVRPLVSDDDYITLDLNPQVSVPDPELNQVLTSGTSTEDGDVNQAVDQLPTTAFEVRSLRTTSRLNDGDAMIMAGLAQFRVEVDSTSTPGLRSIPGLGKMFEGFAEEGDTIELIVVVNPVVEREPSDEGELWAFPTPAELSPWGAGLDVDGDGVPYAQDSCPATPADTEVDARGCPPDGDGDGVPDTLDECPATAAGAQVNEVGCALDGDGDGVPDGIDRCPGTLAGARVDAWGCALDGDGDGVPDGIDRCPGTLAGARVDVTGCALDGDGDGVPDGIDLCPNTPQGAEVDADGCKRAAPLVFEPEKKTLVLEGVGFEWDSDVLTGDSIAVLDRVAESLVDWPEVRVEVGGHTDSTGDEEYNLDLSQRRADSVRAYLLRRGVGGSRIVVRGYGAGQPIMSNSTAEGRRQNRRVELRRLDSE